MDRKWARAAHPESGGAFARELVADLEVEVPEGQLILCSPPPREQSMRIICTHF